MARALYMRAQIIAPIPVGVESSSNIDLSPIELARFAFDGADTMYCPIPGDTHVDVVGQFLGLATDFEVVEGEVGGGVDAPLTTVGRFHLEEQALNLAKGVEIDKCPVFEGKPL